MSRTRKSQPLPDPALQPALHWFEQMGWSAFPFQLQCWQAYLDGQSGLLNAPTGSGKTYALLLPILLDHLRRRTVKNPGLVAIWITPIRALANDIREAGAAAIAGLGLDWRIEVRSGDTQVNVRAAQLKDSPQILVTTPESLHVLLSTRGYPHFFRDLECLIADEWHELLGSKRGVQIELALSRLRSLRPGLRTWGISATIANLQEGAEILLGPGFPSAQIAIVRAEIDRLPEILTVYPDEIETFPWTGHLGILLLQKVIPIIQASDSTLLFTNTRSQSEIWYQRLLDAAPDLAGVIAMHHGSMSRELRDWVEAALHEGRLKAVVCTSSLDLGVDFRPVDTIIQIGSPKGIARFLQRAGRSGHRPGARSRIWFLPTHSLELLEGAAIRRAIEAGQMEARIPYLRSFDVLLQYLMTLAVSEGLEPAQTKAEVTATHAYQSLSDEEWNWCLDFLCTGGSLDAYDEFHRLGLAGDGLYRPMNRQVARRHKLSIGTIVSDHMMQVKFVSGKSLGSVEEWFLSRLNPGDVFWFAGKNLELVRIKDNTAQVRKSAAKNGIVPSWQGGRMPLSSQLSQAIRQSLEAYRRGERPFEELIALEPLLDLQAELSALPGSDELLIEYLEDRDGHHVLIYPFDGRLVHEGMAALLAYRLGRIRPLSISIAMNDYGFELLSDRPIPIEQALEQDLFSTRDLYLDIQSSINAAELAGRRFRDIANIAGLVFEGYPGAQKKERHLQASTRLLFQVFEDYDPSNLLYLQAYEELFQFQLEESRLRAALERINSQQIRLLYLSRPSPFSSPILSDRLREKMSSEKLSDRIAQWKANLVKE